MLEVRTVGGDRLGTVDRRAGGSLAATGLGVDLVASWRRRGVGDGDIYELLSGWSNGYVSAVELAEPVAARFNPAEPRDPHSGEWIGGEIEHVAQKLLDSTKGGGHHVAAYDDFDGVYTSNGHPGRVVAVAMNEGGRSPWHDPDNALGDSLIVDAHSVAAVTADMEALAARARGFKPTPAQIRAAEEHGPILIDTGTTTDHRIAAYFDVNGDRMGFENTPVVAIQSDTISRLQQRHEEYPNLYPADQDWTDAILSAPTDVFVIDARRVAALTDAMRRMAGDVQAAAGIDTHPGGEQLKPDPSIVEMLDMVQAAAGHDVTPGHDQLHHFWTVGKGRVRWVGSPTPWTTLLANLVEEVKDKPLEVLKKWASRWYIEVFGYSAGSDKARVAHGKPPRGKKVGPG